MKILFQNFMTDLIEILIEELPNIMTVKCIMLQ